MPERIQQIEAIFHDACDLAPNERAAFLTQACAGDAALRREVEALLAYDQEAKDFIERPAIELAARQLLANASTAEISATPPRIGAYELQSLLGKGGMGEVHLAFDHRLQRQIAIKLLPPQFTADAQRVRRFTQEARAASALNHPNILTIHEIGEGEGTHYIVTEYVEGETLRQRLTRAPHQQISLRETIEVVAQIAAALAVAHEAGIMHRDIKPENVMVRKDGYVKILDFGLAKLMEPQTRGGDAQTLTQHTSLTEAGIVIGTPRYMSPEQARGEKVDARSDIFSLGVMLYEMVAGRTPFAGTTTSETIAAILRDEPPSLIAIAPDTPPALERVIGQALRKDRTARYQTVQELLGALQQLKKQLEQSPTQNADAESQFPNTVTGNSTLAPPLATTKVDTGKHHRLFAVAMLLALLVSAISLSAYFLWDRKSSLRTTGKKSLAVLPFVNGSQDVNAEYLSDGITESVINNLSQLAGLKVMSRNSAFRFKSNQSDTRNIATQLGVEALVTGDIKQLGDKLIINVRLIDASDDSQIWGNQYVKTSPDILATQNEIAQAIAQSLRVQLSNSEQQRLSKKYTENAEAYQLYLRGRFHVFKLTPTEIQTGISYFREAIAIDPNYALAYVGIADAYRSLALSVELLPTEFLPKSKAAAQKAIELDEALSEGHTALGMAIFWGDWDWAAAENQYKRALELNPNSANAHLFFAHLFSNTGRHAEALAEVKLARELDPLFPFGNALEGQFLLHAGRTDEALAHLQKTFELAPNFWMPHIFAASVYIEKGMYAEASAEARKGRELSSAQTNSEALDAYVLAKLGRGEEARVRLNELLKRATEGFVPPYHLAMIYNGLGEKDEAFAWLERGVQQRDPKMTFLKVDPKWNNLRSDPRFQTLLRRVGFAS